MDLGPLDILEAFHLTHPQVSDSTFHQAHEHIIAIAIA